MTPTALNWSSFLFSVLRLDRPCSYILLCLLRRFSTEAEALAIANAVRVGLAGLSCLNCLHKYSCYEPSLLIIMAIIIVIIIITVYLPHGPITNYHTMYDYMHTKLEVNHQTSIQSASQYSLNFSVTFLLITLLVETSKRLCYAVVSKYHTVF